MYYVVKSLRLANHLVRAGFDIKKVDDSIANSSFKVFLFEDSARLRNIVAKFK